MTVSLCIGKPEKHVRACFGTQAYAWPACRRWVPASSQPST